MSTQFLGQAFWVRGNPLQHFPSSPLQTCAENTFGGVKYDYWFNHAPNPLYNQPPLCSKTWCVPSADIDSTYIPNPISYNRSQVNQPFV